MSYNIIRPTAEAQTLTDPAVLTQLREDLTRDGWVILRGFDADMSKFSALTTALCKKITFDPAREYGEKNTQKGGCVKIIKL
ncbi:hypothetical protein [Roseobacter sp. HKCCD7870]|uniref:hypothetical protein n=1 Tax=Roseobacter sp. HKCCD7870 TaxID=3120343 RepID=UPI0030ECDB10